MIKVEIYSCKMKRERRRFDLLKRVDLFFKKLNLKPEDGDVLVISGKYVAISEGRYYKLNEVVPSELAVNLASVNGADPRLVELILRESDFAIPSFSGIFLASIRGILQPNAGIDKSNVDEGYVVLYPKDPNASARKVRLWVLDKYLKRIGVVISDSRIYPTRKGTTGVAIGYSGIFPIIDERGSKDLFGKKLKVTKRAIADQIATMAQPLMGESNEGRPIVLIRGLSRFVTKKEINVDLSVSYEEDIYFSAIKNYLKGYYYEEK